MKTIFFYFDWTVRQDDNGNFFTFHNESKSNRQFSTLAETVVYCMAIAHNIGSQNAGALAGIVETYISKNN